MHKVVLVRECCGTANTTLSLQDSQFPKFKFFSTALEFPWSSVPEWLIDATREYLLEKDTSSLQLWEPVTLIQGNNYILAGLLLALNLKWKID